MPLVVTRIALSSDPSTSPSTGGTEEDMQLSSPVEDSSTTVVPLLSSTQMQVSDKNTSTVVGADNPPPPSSTQYSSSSKLRLASDANSTAPTPPLPGAMVTDMFDLDVLHRPEPKKDVPEVSKVNTLRRSTVKNPFVSAGFVTEFVGSVDKDLKRLPKEATTADPPRKQDDNVRFYLDPRRVLTDLHPRHLPNSRY